MTDDEFFASMKPDVEGKTDVVWKPALLFVATSDWTSGPVEEFAPATNLTTTTEWTRFRLVYKDTTAEADP